MPDIDSQALVRWLYLDMNSFFASVEQQRRPELRGRPVAVVPTRAETTCCISASYEAKAYRVKTGTLVAEAKKRCPPLVLLEADHREYVRVHQLIIDAVESVLPVEAVCSIDEIACRLSGSQQETEKAIALARRVKEAIQSRAGEYLKCSIGLAPNRYLAKVASDMQKPDGLTVIRLCDLPQILLSLKPRDLPGIGARMEARLARRGIRSLASLLALTAEEMHLLWGSVCGEEMYHLLRGEELEGKETQTQTQSLSRSHVLPPEKRRDEAALEVLKKLLSRAAAALRRDGYYATGFTLWLHYQRGKTWDAKVRLVETQDSLIFFSALRQLWPLRPGGQIFQVGLALTGLVPAAAHAPTFFEDQRQAKLSQLLYQVNRRYGKEILLFGATAEGAKMGQARIAFTRIPDDEEHDIG